MAITKSSFGITSDGEEAFLYRLENTSGAYVTITSFGCRIVSICVPDREGELRDVCLGYDTLAEYEKDTASFGAVVGRHANRIEKGVFILNDKTYHLAVNNGPNHLHGVSVVSIITTGNPHSPAILFVLPVSHRTVKKVIRGH